MRTIMNAGKIAKRVVVSCIASVIIAILDYYMLSVPSPAGCPYEGMRYYDASKGQCAPCTGTCEEPNVPCPRICRSGCACPPGTVLHEGECTPKEECPEKGETPYEARHV